MRPHKESLKFHTYSVLLVCFAHIWIVHSCAKVNIVTWRLHNGSVLLFPLVSCSVFLCKIVITERERVFLPSFELYTIWCWFSIVDVVETGYILLDSLAYQWHWQSDHYCFHLFLPSFFVIYFQIFWSIGYCYFFRYVSNHNTFKHEITTTGKLINNFSY